MSANEQGADAIEGRWLTIPRTLCFVVNSDDVLLMRRAAHKRVFPNRYNGVGGHIERDEDPLSSVRREILEETGLRVRDLRLRAVYNIDAGEVTGIILFVFTAVSDSRNFVSTSEGTLHWIPKQAVEQYDLVEDLPTILPRVLAMGDNGSPLFVHVRYDDEDCIRLRFANE
jgi:8-oxo-dGTP diphosphatase